MKTQINKQTQWQTQNANNIQIRIVARKKRILDDDVVITQDNIQHIGEIIAVATIKTVMCRSGKNLYWLYDGLIQDCKRSNDVNHTYSDGYDIAQTAMLFLCEHIGKQLGDTYITARGKVITVKQACFRFVDRYLDKQYTRHLTHTTALDEATTASTITFIDDESNSDYTAVDTIIKAMRLTPTEYETLSAYMSDLSNIEIAKMLNVNRTTIWRRRNSLISKFAKMSYNTIKYKE